MARKLSFLEVRVAPLAELSAMPEEDTFDVEVG